MTMTETGPVPAPASAPAPAPPPPPLTSGASGVDHKVVGTLYVAVALGFLLIGGVLGLVLRAQLAGPEAELVTDRQFQQFLTYHGAFLVFLFLLPAWTGLATAIVPLQIGAARLAFPRLQATAFWMTVFGGGLMLISPLVGGGKRVLGGWTLSDPLPVGERFAGHGVDYFVVGLALVVVAALVAAVGLITTILKMRTPSMRMRHIPLFSWSVLVSGSVVLLALPVFLAALVLLYVDHAHGGRILTGVTSEGGGNPLLWSRMVWFALYPTLFALLIPALGAVSEMVPVFARRRIARRSVAIGALAAVGIFSFVGWGSEVPDLRPARLLFTLGALVVLAPIASLVLNWLLTVAEGRKQARSGGHEPDLASSPMILVLGFLAVLGLGLAASAVSALDATGDLHQNAWSTGQLHAMFFASSTIALVAALHYWGPKLWGFHLSSGLARLELLLLAGGALLMVASELVLGLQDMPAQTSTYTSGDGWQAASLGAGLGGAAIGLGTVVVIADLLRGLSNRRRHPADGDPWGGHTLEWATSSPPPPHNFDRMPDVRSETPLLDLREAEAKAAEAQAAEAKATAATGDTDE